MARWLLRAVLPPDFVDVIEGDLRERFAAKAEERGQASAVVWYWGQVLALEPWALARLSRSKGRGGMRTGLREDLRDAYRQMVRRPGPSWTTVGTIAVALAATTTIFTVVRGVLLRPLPYPDAERLVQVWGTYEPWFDTPDPVLRTVARTIPFSYSAVQEWEADLRGLESVGAFTGRDFEEWLGNRMELLTGLTATSGVFTSLGVEPALGRFLVPEDDRPGAEAVVVLSSGLWADRFGSDPSALGRTLVLDGVSHTVVGVMPPDFYFPTPDVRVWTSFSEERKASAFDDRFYAAVGRLSSGYDIEAAEAEMIAVAERVELEGTGEAGHSIRLASRMEEVVGPFQVTLWYLLGAGALVLVVACLNVANLLRAVGISRRRDLAVRAAHGAGHLRLLRGQLVFGGLLAVLGGASAILLTWLSVPLLLDSLPTALPRQTEVQIDFGVLAFGLAATVLTGLTASILPGLDAGRTLPAAVLREERRGAIGRQGNRLRWALVTGEIAVACLLLVGAGLLGVSFVRLAGVEPGFETDGLGVLEFARTPNEASPEAYLDWTRRVSDRIASVPGVSGVAAANEVPLIGGISSTDWYVPSEDGERIEIPGMVSVVSPNFFELMGIAIVAGRGFEDDAPALIVNEAMAARVWPGESAVGKHLATDSDGELIDVVGVARDVRHRSLGQEAEPKVYVPLERDRRRASIWVVRSSGDPTNVLPAVRAEMAQAFPDLAIRRTQVMGEVVREAVGLPRFRAGLVIGLAGLAAGLALLGVYAVVNFQVTEQRRNIAIRIALGAERTNVLTGVVLSALGVAAVGIVLGYAAALASGRVVAGFLFGVGAKDPITYTGVGLILFGVVALATWMPARRAARVDPMTLLRTD